MFVGISKTGVPGIGILVVPLLAYGFGGRLSAGVMLPMLIMGDLFAVAWYRRHAQWDKLVGLLPWVYGGVALGTAGAFGVARILKNFLFGITSNDPLILVGVPLALLAVAVLASYLPARRAAKVEPMEALRYE